MAGNRVTNFLYIFSQLKFISEHGNKLGCVFKNLVVEKEVRWGLFSKYFLKCETCNETFKIENVDNNTSNESDINDAAVKAIKSMERGLDDLEKFMVALDIPFLLPKKYEKHHNVGGVEQQEDPLEITKAKTSRKLSDDDNSSSQKKQKVEEDGNTNLSSELSIKNESLAKDSSEGAVKEEEIFIKEELMEDEESQPSTSFTSQNDATTDNTTLKKEVPGFMLKNRTEMDTDSENENSLSSLETREGAEVASLNSLPEKTRRVYKATFEAFLNWKKEKKNTSFSESTLLEYFTELSAKYKPSTLWTHYSMLRSMINIRHGINLEHYNKLRTLLKRKSIGFQPKKAKTFSPENINDFLTKASDDIYLATKVSLIMGVMGACRANEMHRMKITDLQDLGSAFLVHVPNIKTKITRRFTITDKFYQICKKYMNLRPSHVTTDVFFLNYQNVVEVPESILNEANEAIVPKKSKPRYEKASRKAYNAFKQWQGENDFRVVNEVVLLAYFMQLSKKHSPSSLWVYYSMLRTTFNVNENIDIKYFKKLNAFIKNQNIGNKVKKTKLLSDDEFRKFLVEARDEDYLLDKVVAIFGVFGACRCEEIYNLTINDVKQEGSVLIVTIHQTRNCKSRFFTLMSDSAVNPVEIVKKYMDLRPKHTSHEHFFVVYNRGKCSVQRVGIQKISSIPKRIATFLGLPNVKQYTGHCLRRSSATILAKINVTNLKRLK